MINGIFKYSFAFPLAIAVCSSNIAIADSGYSALPPKETAFKQYLYDTYAPKTQTTFKEFETVTQPVDKILQDNKKLMLYGGLLTGGSTFANAIKPTANIPYVGVGVRIAQAGGSAVAIVGALGTIPYMDFKSGSIVKHKVYFRWTNPQLFEYAVRTDSWVEYRGTRVSEVKSSTKYFIT